MIKTIERLVQKYDAATVFVSVATLFVIIELSLMRVFVPATASANMYGSGALVDQVYNDDSVQKVRNNLHSWKEMTDDFVRTTNASIGSWQKNLNSQYVFAFEKKEVQDPSQEVNEKQLQIAAANFAVGQLYLQSVMTGSTPLANINGTIYRMGDEIPIRGGEIIMLLTELGSDYAKVQLAESLEIERTIYISRDSQYANGDRLP